MPDVLVEPVHTSLDARFDAILVVSFGGPEGPQEVLPFLERVTAGRGIPATRLAEVGQHYFALGGVSPINAQNRALVAALRSCLVEMGVEIPIALGNRNSQPFIQHALQQLAAQGCRQVLAVATSAFSSYSGCRQYREDLAGAAAEAGVAELAVVKLAPFWALPAFIDAVAARIVETLRGLPSSWPAQPEILFTTHSIPVSQEESSGPGGPYPGMGYTAQHLYVASRALDRVVPALGWPESPPARLVYQSRSGPPHVPWLEPDVNDALELLAERGVGHVVVVPIGFLSDHMEVVWDLDTQAKATATRLGIDLVRVPTVGTHPAFVSGMATVLADLAWTQPTITHRASDGAERQDGIREAATTELLAGTQSGKVVPIATPAFCSTDCCPNPRGSRPVVAGVAPSGGVSL